MTEEFSLEPVEVTKEVTTTVTEYHKLNATCDALRYNIDNNIPIPEGTVFGLVLPSESGFMENDVPGSDSVDEEGNTVEIKKYNDVLYIAQSVEDKSYIWVASANTFKGSICGCNIKKAKDVDFMNDLVEELQASDTEYEVYTPSSFNELLNNVKPVYEGDDF